jgi:hypothetical protein
MYIAILTLLAIQQYQNLGIIILYTVHFESELSHISLYSSHTLTVIIMAIIYKSLKIIY